MRVKRSKSVNGVRVATDTPLYIMNQNDVELKGCPFCGHEPIVLDKGFVEKRIYCGNCNYSKIECFDDMAFAAKEWNTRIDNSSELVAALKLCRAKLQEGEGVEEWLCPDFTNEINAIDAALAKSTKRSE